MFRDLILSVVILLLYSDLSEDESKRNNADDTRPSGRITVSAVDNQNEGFARSSTSYIETMIAVLMGPKGDKHSRSVRTSYTVTTYSYKEKGRRDLIK